MNIVLEINDTLYVSGGMVHVWPSEGIEPELVISTSWDVGTFAYSLNYETMDSMPNEHGIVLRVHLQQWINEGQICPEHGIIHPGITCQEINGGGYPTEEEWERF